MEDRLLFGLPHETIGKRQNFIASCLLYFTVYQARESCVAKTRQIDLTNGGSMEATKANILVMGWKRTIKKICAVGWRAAKARVLEGGG